MLIIRLLIIFFFFVNYNLFADSYFDKLVNSAYKNNFIIKSYKNYLKSVKKDVDIATGYFFPKIDFEYSISGTKEPGQAAFIKAKQGRFTMDYYYKYMTNPPFVKDYRFMISLIQPIFAKGKIYLSKKQAKLNYEAANFSLNEIKREIKFNIFKILINANKLFENIKIAENMKKRAEIYFNTIENQYKNGTALKSDLLFTKYHLKKAEINLQVLKNNLNKLEYNLKQLTGEYFPLKQVNFKITETINIDSLIQYGVKNRDDLMAFRNLVKIAQIEVKKKRNEYLPEVFGFANYEKNSEKIFNSDESGYTVGIGLKMNIFNGMIDRNNILKAKYNLLRMKNMLMNREENLKREIKESFIDYKNARFTYNTIKKLVESNRLALQISERRFKQGLERITTLVDMETNYKNSLNKLNEAKWNMVLKYYTILYKAGKF